MAIGWALLGPGRHADRDVVPEMKEAADTRLVAVLSRDRQRGEAYAEKHGFLRAYDSLEELLKDPEVDALYDSTPDGLHISNTLQAAAAGKHVLVEKPLAISVEECRQSIEACQRNGVKLGAVFQERHQPAHQEVRRMVQSGEIGEVMLTRVQLAWPFQGGGTQEQRDSSWRGDPLMRPGGSMMGSGDHCYDTLRYFTAQEVVEVVAFTDSTREISPNERMALAMMKLEGGGYAYIFASRRTPFAQEDIVVHGTRGTLVCANTFRTANQGLTGESRLESISPDGRTTRIFEKVQTYKEEIEQFNRCIQGDGEPMTSGQEGLINIAITEAIYESARTGRVVPVAEKLRG